jgi:RNA polymerase sigma factor (sigma-70 family)
MSTGETVAETMPQPRGVAVRLLGDRQLTRLAARGHTAAFEAIFRRYHQELYRYCWAILSDPHEAEDALQGTMTAVVRALPGERRRIELRPWLYRIARNEAMSIVRRRVISVNPQELPDAALASVDSDTETRERLRQLVADLSGLPDRQRSALVMRELSGLSYGEIAVALDASEAAARQAVYEARVALRELEGGREMQCEEARQALSEHDGRVLRRRRLRAHLRACEGCRDFRAAIGRRRSDLEALCPPLSAAMASGIVASILGQGGTAGVGVATGSAAAAGAAGTGAGGAAAGATIAASAGIKGASIAAAVALGAGAAGAAGVVELPWVPDQGARDSTPASLESGRRGSGDAAPPADRRSVPPSNPSPVSRDGAAASGRGSAVDRTANGNDRAGGTNPLTDEPAGSDGYGAAPVKSQGQSEHPPAAVGDPPAAVDDPAADVSGGQGDPPAHATGGPPPHALAGGSETAVAMRRGGASAGSGGSSPTYRPNPPTAHQSRPAPHADGTPSPALELEVPSPSAGSGKP